MRGERLAAHGLVLPEGHTFVTLDERADLAREIGVLGASVWPEFMLHDATGRALGPPVGRLGLEPGLPVRPGRRDGRGHAQRAARVGQDGRGAARKLGRAARAVRGSGLGRPPPRPTLGALMIAVRPDRQGGGHAGTMLGAMRALAQGSAAFARSSRASHPTGKAPYALVPIERYSTWTRDDGLPLDPWIRLHVRLGARIVRGVPRSMTIRGTVAEWREWTGLAMPGQRPVPARGCGRRR